MTSEAAEQLETNEAVAIPIPYYSDLTYNELHAAILGAGAGITELMAWTAGRQEIAAILAIVLASYAIVGHPLGRSQKVDDSELPIGIRTIKHEPWYFLGLMTTVAGGGLFV